MDFTGDFSNIGRDCQGIWTCVYMNVVGYGCTGVIAVGLIMSIPI